MRFSLLRTVTNPPTDAFPGPKASCGSSLWPRPLPPPVSPRCPSQPGLPLALWPQKVLEFTSNGADTRTQACRPHPGPPTAVHPPSPFLGPLPAPTRGHPHLGGPVSTPQPRSLAYKVLPGQLLPRDPDDPVCRPQLALKYTRLGVLQGSGVTRPGGREGGDGAGAWPLGGRTGRIQLLDEVVGVPVVLGEEAQGHGCDGVVAPGAVEAAEEVLALLRGKRCERPTQPRLLPTRGPRSGGSCAAPESQLSTQDSVWQPSWETSRHKGNADSSSSDPVITPGTTEPRGAGCEGLVGREPVLCAGIPALGKEQ